MVGEEYHVIDFYQNSGEGLRHYMKVLKDRGYVYVEHWGPHDIDNREFSSDAKTRREMAREGYEIDGQHYRMTFQVVSKIGVDDGIDQVRDILPHCAFDEAKCEEGISVPSAEMVAAAALADPLQLEARKGVQRISIAGALDQFGTKKAAEIIGGIQIGSSLGETSQQIGLRLTSIHQLQQDQASSLVRTMTNHIASTARVEMLKASRFR